MFVPSVDDDTGVNLARVRFDRVPINLVRIRGDGGVTRMGMLVIEGAPLEGAFVFELHRKAR